MCKEKKHLQFSDQSTNVNHLIFADQSIYDNHLIFSDQSTYDNHLIIFSDNSTYMIITFYFLISLPMIITLYFLISLPMIITLNCLISVPMSITSYFLINLTTYCLFSDQSTYMTTLWMIMTAYDNHLILGDAYWVLFCPFLDSLLEKFFRYISQVTKLEDKNTIRVRIQFRVHSRTDTN